MDGCSSGGTRYTYFSSNFVVSVFSVSKTFISKNAAKKNLVGLEIIYFCFSSVCWVILGSYVFYCR